MQGGLVGIIYLLCVWLREKLTPKNPPGNFENLELYYKDIANGVSFEQCQENIKNGRYKAPSDYKEPHRDPVTKKIIIENRALYDADSKKYSASKVYEWMKKGKYNLPSKELKK